MLIFVGCFLLVVSSSSLAINCPNGFSELNNNTCYQYFEKQATYFEASEHCNQLGGSLVSIGNTHDNWLIASEISFNVFIGLQCYSSSQCEWDDGSNSNFTYFYYPIELKNGSCVDLQPGTGYWFNAPCNNTRSYVCEVKKGNYQFNYQGFSYNPYTIALSENEAEDICEQDCAHLVSIHSYGENTFVKSLFDANVPYIRIGAQLQNNNNFWIDNSSWTYQNIGYQNSNFGSCYSMSLTNDVVASGKWISSQCQKALPFVCKREEGVICGPTAAPTLAPSQCNGSQFLGPKGYIYSPNYPYSYTSENQSCTYILSTPLGTIAYINFTDFNVDQTTTFALYNSIEDENPFIVFNKYFLPNDTYTSTSNIIKVVFHSKKSSDNTGYLWKAGYDYNIVQPTMTPIPSTQPPISVCGFASYYVPPATITYPYTNGHLPDNQKCVYSISAGYGNRIKISFGYSHLYQGGQITVYDGASTSSPILLTLQNGPTYWYNSSSNHMLLYVNTYSSYDNFSANIQVL